MFWRGTRNDPFLRWRPSPVIFVIFCDNVILVLCVLHAEVIHVYLFLMSTQIQSITCFTCLCNVARWIVQSIVPGKYRKCSAGVDTDSEMCRTAVSYPAFCLFLTSACDYPLLERKGCAHLHISTVFAGFRVQVEIFVVENNLFSFWGTKSSAHPIKYYMKLWKSN